MLFFLICFNRYSFGIPMAEVATSQWPPSGRPVAAQWPPQWPPSGRPQIMVFRIKYAFKKKARVLCIFFKSRN